MSATTMRAVITEVQGLFGETPAPAPTPAASRQSARELLAERDRLDAEICDLLGRAHAQSGQDVAAARALGRLRQYMHDDLAEEMKLTKKPLFAEIAKGKSAE